MANIARQWEPMTRKEGEGKWEVAEFRKEIEINEKNISRIKNILQGNQSE